MQELLVFEMFVFFKVETSVQKFHDFIGGFTFAFFIASQ